MPIKGSVFNLLYLKYNVHTLSVCYFLNHKFRSIMHCSIYMVCLRTFRNCSMCIMIILLWNLWTRRFFVNQKSDIATSCPRGVSFHLIFLRKHTPDLREIINIEGNPGSNSQVSPFLSVLESQLVYSWSYDNQRFYPSSMLSQKLNSWTYNFDWGFWA